MTASSKRNDYVHLVAEGQGMDVNVYAFIKRRGILRILIINEYVKKEALNKLSQTKKSFFHNITIMFNAYVSILDMPIMCRKDMISYI